MARCPSCDYPLPDDRERMGARCPSCRDPLYEPPGRFGRPVRTGEAACTVHTGNESIGTCARCGNYFCEICRCNWRGKLLCLACVERALDSEEGTPEQNRTHFQQALLSLLFGIGTWVLAGLLILLMQMVGSQSEQAAMSMAVFCGLGMLALILLALFGVGQGAAAIRTRGNHMIMANFGVIFSGLYVGVLIGLFGVSLWRYMP